MLKTQKLVHDMMVALELPLPNEDRPGVQGLNFELLRDLVDEETDEFLDWMENLEGLVKEGLPVDEAWAQVIDAMCDLIVVIHNTSNAMGIDLEPFFDEVHCSNMAKAGGPKRKDGKAMKPEGWQAPRIEEMLKKLLSPGNPCSHIQCREEAKYGLLRAGDSQELHYHVCAAHLQEFVEDAEHCTVWVLEDEG